MKYLKNGMSVEQIAENLHLYTVDAIKEVNKQKELNNEIKIMHKEGKSGIGQDWNFGVSKTTTDYVTVAHQDDIYNENYLEEIIKEINKDKDFVIAFGNYEEIKNGKVIPLTNNLKIKKILQKPLIKHGDKMWAKRFALRFGSAICCPCVTVNTKILGKTPYKVELKCDLDWDTWLEYSKMNYRFLYINKPLMKHRIHEESETSNLIENNIRLEEDYEMLKKLWPKPIAKIVMHFYKNAVKTNS